MIELYNTLTKKNETFEPITDKKVRMFVCGPTVYDLIHIGNARTFTVFDAFAKYLRHRGFEVDYIQNITDIDDKIIKRAAENGVSPLEYAARFTHEFKKDMAGLGVTAPRLVPATEHIPQVIAQVKRLIETGHAYRIDGDGWYFDLTTFPGYGKLSGRTAGMADDAISRIDESDKKRNRGDFCVWKFSKPKEPSWPDAELGDGRPGWHIEDTAITEHYFGPQYDLHGGGQDLIFPHHEAEIAQQESASGKEPFVKYWLHVAFLISKDAKMSKSLGNFSTLRDVLGRYSAPTVRQYLLAAAHYKTPLEFSDAILESIVAGQRSLAGAIGKALFLAAKDALASGAPTLAAAACLEKIQANLDADFNVPMAAGTLSGFVSQAVELMEAGSFTEADYAEFQKIISFFDTVLGIIPAVSLDLPAGQKIDELRQAERYAESDALRKEYQAAGLTVENTKHGTLVLKFAAR
ncbi:MAG TPA: cysteine--tRNA ligase [Candidatus Paceibacterota bacterium]|nr:cysteine--tRNA ligase [Candidatus Paceibacterota bacterium]